MQKISFDLREVLQGVYGMYGHLASEAGIAFIVAIDMDNPLLVCSSPDHVEQVLVILLDNAIKHTPAGGEIALTAEDKGSLVEVAVMNSGEIPAEDLPHIFERFYTADRSHSGDGSGLGLSIAQEIMSRLGERLFVESCGGKTRFAFTVCQRDIYGRKQQKQSEEPASLDAGSSL